MSATGHPTNGLDETVHQRHRLGILTIAAEAESADFGYLRDALGLTPGNLSRHLTVLEEAGLIQVRKGYEGRGREPGCGSPGRQVGADGRDRRPHGVAPSPRAGPAGLDGRRPMRPAGSVISSGRVAMSGPTGSRVLNRLASMAAAVDLNFSISPYGRATSMAPSIALMISRAVSRADPANRTVPSDPPCSSTRSSQRPLPSKNLTTSACMAAGRVVVLRCQHPAQAHPSLAHYIGIQADISVKSGRRRPSGGVDRDERLAETSRVAGDQRLAELGLAAVVVMQRSLGDLQVGRHVGVAEGPKPLACTTPSATSRIRVDVPTRPACVVISAPWLDCGADHPEIA